MSEIIIYHNPRCSKSRQALALLADQGIQPTIIKYLQDPLKHEQLKELLKKLTINPRQLLRTKEADYTQLNLGDQTLSDDALIDAMIHHPKLIERPIVVKGDRAVIGRPPENVLTIVS